ncbi:phospholipase C [Paracidobacterium acidisoli]|uniref:Phospholipase n=1 Tax=Paracidobacterium acidisoli TaxID=2303751 RepID=A0A372ITS5_9BACT|nr:alkaline phosphatase family protein [Paracidobacterium acidisoli]MBT9329741.1 alkaline phosphatase family protein [Paracidobacterium acidisoli]
MQRSLASSLAAILVASQMGGPALASAQVDSPTATPIKHVVVIFGENISFDHYFGTYPTALNPKGEPRFVAAPGTPSVNGYTDALLYNNPNALNKTGNGTGATNPFRLDRSQAATADQDHDYTPEQEAFHGGLMDSFPQYTGTPGPPPTGQATNGLVMGYYDGNTVTALWNYAQRYAINDNSYDTNFGPSTPGAINLISGQTNGVGDQMNATGDVIEDGSGGYTLISDADPIGDVCSTTTGAVVQMTGQNIGDLLNAKGISWGWFEGGFDLTAKNPNGTTNCSRSHTSAITNTNKADYIPHHEPFQYYTSTANPKHTRPSSVRRIGEQGDGANHQYDTSDFFAAVKAGNFPAVSFLKAPGYQDAHAGYSDPIDEQAFVVQVINFLETQPEWSSTAVFINYDDSDGWYDHQLGQIVNQSTTAADALTAPGQCGNGTETALPGPNNVQHAQGRCGYGPRLPLMLISPWSKQNYVDHTLTDQSSIIRFIEDNWLKSQRIGNGSFDAIAGSVNNMFDFNRRDNGGVYVLDPSTGLVLTNGGSGHGDGGFGGFGGR